MITATKKPAREIAVSQTGETKKASFPRKEYAETTLGRSIFQDGIDGARTLPDIKDKLEMKYAVCVFTGGANGLPIPIEQIENPISRQFVIRALVGDRWTTANLATCQGRLAIPAGGMLNATLGNPVWGEDDFHLFRLLQSLKEFQQKALRGGLTL